MTRRPGFDPRIYQIVMLASLLAYDMVQWIAPQFGSLDAQTASRAGHKGVYNQAGESMRRTAAAAST